MKTNEQRVWTQEEKEMAMRLLASKGILVGLDHFVVNLQCELTAALAENAKQAEQIREARELLDRAQPASFANVEVCRSWYARRASWQTAPPKDTPTEGKGEAMAEGPFCAHSVVRHNPEDVGQRMFHERWTCSDCGTEFVPRSAMDAMISPLKDDLFTQQDINEAYERGTTTGLHEARNAVMTVLAKRRNPPSAGA